MLRRRPSLIAFDLDGTLVDSAPDIAYAVDQMLLHLGLEPQGEEQVGHVGSKGINGVSLALRRSPADGRGAGDFYGGLSGPPR